MKEQCVAPSVEHDVEFVVAANGSCCFQCKLCKLFFDEAEDALIG
jgi:hypothetical protein